MPGNVPRVYADANVLLAYVGNEAGRADTVESILEDARESRVELLTSVLSIAEVAYVQSDSSSDFSSAGDAAIDELWKPASPVTIVDISETVAREARGVIRNARQRSIGRVGAADAIHLASAQLHECDRFFTYEHENMRQRWETLIGAGVTEPFTDAPQLGFNG